MERKKLPLIDNDVNFIKIVHMTSVHPAFDTRIFYKECRSLANGSYDVTLIAPHCTTESIDGVRIIGVTLGRKRVARMIKTTFEVFQQALKEKADLYHIHDPELLVYGQLLRVLGCRVVFDMHENLPKAILSKRWLNRFFRKPISALVRFVERMLLMGLPIVFAETSYVKDYKWVKQHVTVLNMPDVRDFPLIDAEKYAAKTLGYVGAVTVERGSLVTFDALEILYKEGFKIDFECIGPVRGDTQVEYLKNMNHEVFKRTKLIGYMRSSEAWKRIAKCHIGLAVLKATPNYLESYPTKMFEYMAMGLPVVVSDFPLYRNIVERFNCGVCVDPESPEEVAFAIKQLLLMPEEAERMGQRGRQAVINTYNWQYEMDKINLLYDFVLAGKGSLNLS